VVERAWARPRQDPGVPVRRREKSRRVRVVLASQDSVPLVESLAEILSKPDVLGIALTYQDRLSRKIVRINLRMPRRAVAKAPRQRKTGASIDAPGVLRG